MDEKALRNIAIFCSISGLVILFFVSERLELEKTRISDIGIDDLGKNVRICGIIDSKFVSKNGHIFLRISDETSGIGVVIFNDTGKNLKEYNIDPYKLENHGKICVIGYIDEYNDEIEIIGKKVEPNQETV